MARHLRTQVDSQGEEPTSDIARTHRDQSQQAAESDRHRTARDSHVSDEVQTVDPFDFDEEWRDPLSVGIADGSPDVFAKERFRRKALFTLASIVAVLAISNYVIGFPRVYHLRLLVHTVDSSVSSIGGGGQDDAAADMSSPSSVSPSGNPTREELTRQAAHLVIDGVTLDLSEEEVSVGVGQGGIQVTQTLDSPIRDTTALMGWPCCRKQRDTDCLPPFVRRLGEWCHRRQVLSLRLRLPRVHHRRLPRLLRGAWDRHGAASVGSRRRLTGVGRTFRTGSC